MDDDEIEDRIIDEVGRHLIDGGSFTTDGGRTMTLKMVATEQEQVLRRLTALEEAFAALEKQMKR